VVLTRSITVARARWAEFIEVLTDRGERRSEALGLRDVVETNEA
jgi:hypothetical protein